MIAPWNSRRSAATLTAAGLVLAAALLSACGSTSDSGSAPISADGGVERPVPADPADLLAQAVSRIAPGHSVVSVTAAASTQYVTDKPLPQEMAALTAISGVTWGTPACTDYACQLDGDLRLADGSPGQVAVSAVGAGDTQSGSPASGGGLVVVTVKSAAAPQP